MYPPENISTDVHYMFQQENVHWQAIMLIVQATNNAVAA